MTKAKTGAERQREFRARKLKENIAEVRGIFLPVEYHFHLKNFAKTMISQNHPISEKCGELKDGEIE